MNNGMHTFAFHSADGGPTPTVHAEFAMATRSAAPLGDFGGLDPETAAHTYLRTALASAGMPSFAAPEVNSHASEFRSLGVETIQFTDTRTVKFRQYCHKIPVYGSLVTVELDQENRLLSINSAMGEPQNVDPVANISPAQVIDHVRKLAGGPATQPIDATPRLYFYFVSAANRWHLVYIVEDVLIQSGPAASGLPQYRDFVIDAHTGKLVAELQRTQTAVPTAALASNGTPPQPATAAPHEKVVSAPDELNHTRKLLVTRVRAGVWRLYDRQHNVHTHDFEFRDVVTQTALLPGRYVENPPKPWPTGGISAHANAVSVAAYLREVFTRNGLDNQGGPIVSSVNCLYAGQSIGREWHNAARIPGQMIYGQRLVNGRLVSYAAAADVVAHELLHGLTDNTARLEYRGESGALNESYSDIFGIIISNRSNPVLNGWNWDLGEDLSANGDPLRDFRNPARLGQPEHMRDYVHLPESDDFGGVHTNSGIHNKAAYNILVTRDAQGHLLFDPETVARLFYLALTQQLSRTSGFADSRRGVLVSAKTLLRNDAQLTTKLAAIANAFQATGIVDGNP